MNDARITFDEWRVLYEEALAFKRLGCWDWMTDSDLFGVENPGSGDVGYCCVLGAAASIYALVVYRGSDGLEFHRKVQGRIISPEDREALFAQNAMMVSFESRRTLDADDRAVIRSLGLKLKGAKEWPQFRSYLPGYLPWHITQEEAAFLTYALRQATVVATRLKTEPDILEPREDGTYFVRVPIRKSGEIAWTEEWRAPSPVKRSTTVAPPVPEEHLEKIRRIATRVGNNWEIDFFFTPVAVKEGAWQRPYFPRAYCCMERESGKALDMQVAENEEASLQKLRDAWLLLVERIRVLPRTIFVKRGDVFDVFEPLAKFLGVSIVMDENPMVIDHFIKEMDKYFRRK